MVYLVGAVFFLAALVPTYVLSRVLLVFFWRSDSGPPMIAACHIGAYLFCVLVGAIGFAAGDGGDGGAKVGLAALSFLFPQVIWMVTDVARFEKRAVAERPQVARPPRPQQMPVALLPPPDHFQGR